MKTSTITGLMLLLLAPGLPAQTPNGETIFLSTCATCHLAPTSPEIPNLDSLARYEPNAILMALTDGVMRLQAQTLNDADRVAVTEYLTKRQVPAPAAQFTSGMCKRQKPMAAPDSGPLWNGWGSGTSNRRFQTVPGLSVADLPKLKLKWAFGIPDASQSRSQPAVAGGRLFMGSQTGAVYALDARTGCTLWIFKAGAGVRTAISVGPILTADQSSYAIYFADAQAVAYAVDANSGKLIWSRKLDPHPAARATGAPVLHDGRLYVPLSGVSEESTAVDPKYGCCTFRGSISALDARTGSIIWKTYLVDEPKPRGKSSTGVQLYGPAGVGVWSAPTIDPKRGLLYAATGNAYADPQPPTSDAVVALALSDGSIKWVNQIFPHDVWIMGCDLQSSGGNPKAGENPNCPRQVGPDYDFSDSPILATTAGGRELLIIAQKSGVGYALDPDQQGKTVWEYRWGQGSPIGGVWGPGVDERAAYFAVADIVAPEPGGVHAVDLQTGHRIWYTPPEKPLCGSVPGCSAVQAAAVTVIDGVVFSGSHDGALRAYDAATGKIVWTYDTNREYKTRNGVKARGGSIDGPGPIIAGRMLYITSGNGGMFGLPGNVLLALAPDGKVTQQ